MYYPATRAAVREPLSGTVQPDLMDPCVPDEPTVWDRAADEAGQWVGEHPVICVAIGMALGATVGWLIKRK